MCKEPISVPVTVATSFVKTNDHVKVRNSHFGEPFIKLLGKRLVLRADLNDSMEK